MDDRDDPVVAASQQVLRVTEAAIDLGGLATVGSIRAYPGTPTAVAGRVELTVDLRHRDLAGLQELERRVIGESEPLWSIDPIAFDPTLMTGAAAGEPLVSGPLHDAAACARAGVPTAMLFVRSRGGVSHSREEDSDEADVIAGVEALVRVVRELANP
jgi:N-carbamoyl-L-amino-acid hydrolase